MINEDTSPCLISTTNPISLPFPADTDPTLKTDFEVEGHLMVIFANPLSGSQEGLTILELGGQYRVSTVNDYMVLKFPECSNSMANETASSVLPIAGN